MAPEEDRQGRREDDKVLDLILEQNEKDHGYINSSVENLSKEVKEIHKLLAGNGKVGIVGQIALLRQRLNISWGFITVLFAAVIGAVVRHFVT